MHPPTAPISLKVQIQTIGYTAMPRWCPPSSWEAGLRRCVCVCLHVHMCLCVHACMCTRVPEAPQAV